MSDADALAVLSLFTDCCTRWEMQPVEHQGFSGARIWKVVAGGAPFLAPLCLKRWPESHPPPARLPWIHQVLHRARERGIGFVPQIHLTNARQSSCEFAGTTWELMSWLPGDVETSRTPSPQRVAAAFRALAAFHQVTADVQSGQVTASQTAPAIADRVSRWREFAGGDIEQIQQAFQSRRIPLIDDLASQWIARQRKLPIRIASQLVDAAKLSLPLQPAIRDLWRDHVLFEGITVTGFIDFGAMRFDTPLTDIARLIGSLAGDDAGLRKIAVDAYSAVMPLSAADGELIDLLDHSGSLIAGWNWLQWLYVEGRQFPSLSAVASRMTELLARCRKPEE
jgi:Ser/Thr protein kinase RdoA (MazF antagonist)